MNVNLSSSFITPSQTNTSPSTHNAPPLLPRAASALALSGDTQCELALLVLKALPDDVYSDGVSVPRRNEMLSALHKEMPAVLDYLSQIMSRTMDGQHSAERIIILEALCGGEVFGFGVEGLGFGV